MSQSVITTVGVNIYFELSSHVHLTDPGIFHNIYRINYETDKRGVRESFPQCTRPSCMSRDKSVIAKVVDKTESINCAE